MIRLVLWSMDGDGWQRVAAVPVSAERGASALANARTWFTARHTGLVRVELEPLPEPLPALAAVA